MKFLLFILLGFQVVCEAGLLEPGYEFSRATGMGNAFIALADDANALFYNPAALARKKGLSLHLIDTQISVDTLGTLDRMFEAASSGNTEGLIDPNKANLGIVAKPTFIAPYFGISLFSYGFGSIDLQSLQGEKVRAYAFNDLGVVMAFGIPFSDYFSFGVSLRALQRSSVDVDRPTQDFLTELGMTESTVNSDPWSALSKYVGVGYAFPVNLGILASLPQWSKASPLVRFGATIENMGLTEFTRISGAQAPAKLETAYHFGALLQYTLSKSLVLNLTGDMRNQFRDLPFFKTFHFGTELKHSLFALRTGVYQGYPTFGASLEFPPQFRVHLSTYSMESGETLWEKEQRWYQIQVIVGFNPF